MKKIKILIFVICIFNSCVVSKKKAIYSKNNYTIVNLDSINNEYLIYATKRDSLYKIISKKKYDCRRSNPIKIGKTYELNIRSITNPIRFVEPAINIGNYLDIPCFDFDDDTSICIDVDNGIFELYDTENLCGLNYMPFSCAKSSK